MCEPAKICPPIDHILVSPEEGRQEQIGFLQSVPLISLRAHINQFEVTHQIITDCWVYFRQINKKAMAKYGPRGSDKNIL